MSSRKRKRKKSQQAPWNVPGFIAGTVFQIIVFVSAFLVLLARRPDAVLNAQFYAEDGMQWFPDAYRFGLHSYMMPVAGYLHAFIRTVALISLLFPFSLAPLVMNLCAAVVQILPATVFLSFRFSNISLKIRLLACAVYICLPNSWEIHANITNVQWHLALLACLLLLAQPTTNMCWRIFDATVLVLSSFSTPLAILLVLVAAAIWWKRRLNSSAVSFLLLIPGAVVEVLFALFSHTRQSAELGANLLRLCFILGGQIFLASLVGMQNLLWLGPHAFGVIGLPALISMVTIGLFVLLYALRYGPFELKMFVLFCFGVLALGLARPLAGTAAHPQWAYLCLPGRGNRYYFFPMIGYLASLFWIASRAPIKGVRYFAIALLCLLPIGIYGDWSYPPFQDYNFRQYAQQFERAPSGTKVSIPINPGMTMEITKR
jgi:hypothetical protein